MILYIILALVALVALAVFIIAYICYRKAFYVPPRKNTGKPELDLPEGEIYEPFHASMRRWAQQTRALPQERVSITSFDGLTLYGTFYEFAPGAPVEIMFHGYRGNPDRDLSGGVQRCFKLGRSCLMVTQRATGESGGNTITFGINEHKDCLRWVEFAAEKFGPDVKLILTGISMGAATVLMAAANPLPENVLGVLADCSYSTPKEIIKRVIADVGIFPELGYPFVKLGAKVFGHFDLEETSPLKAMKSCTVPVIFFHGEDDDYVPCYMSRRLYRACKTRKMLVTVPGAGHGLSYPVGKEHYLEAAREFFGAEGSFGEE